MSAAAYRLHPGNRGFEWQVGRSTELRRVTPEQKAQFDRDGFFILRNAFTPAEVAAVEAAIDPLEREHEQLLRANGKTNAISSADAITFTGHIVKKSPVLRAFAAHPAICDVCHDLIGDDVRLYWDQSVYKKSGKPQEFPWHQDNGYTYVEPQQYLTFWIPLVDVDVDNGCPWIAPGLHRLGTLEHWATPLGYRCLENVPDAVPAEGKVGDAIVFSSLAPHRTGPNLKQGTVRKAYILQYAPDGAEAIMKDGSHVPQSDPDRQFPILQRGMRQ
ncbi:MAG TPA: phytanoyl-CoA dioxygenase family protein [Rhizomicrobium sp.]|jgi:ectoine hydroxylase-related dioxygenase (phytanoyl-CoA dioxygenase family)